MLTCRDLFLEEVREKLGYIVALKTQKACEFLSKCDHTSDSIWMGSEGDILRLKYKEANQILTDIKKKL